MDLFGLLFLVNHVPIRYLESCSYYKHIHVLYIFTFNVYYAG